MMMMTIGYRFYNVLPESIKIVTKVNLIDQ